MFWVHLWKSLMGILFVYDLLGCQSFEIGFIRLRIWRTKDSFFNGLTSSWMLLQVWIDASWIWRYYILNLMHWIWSTIESHATVELMSRIDIHLMLLFNLMLLLKLNFAIHVMLLELMLRLDTILHALIWYYTWTYCYYTWICCYCCLLLLLPTL